MEKCIEYLRILQLEEAECLSTGSCLLLLNGGFKGPPAPFFQTVHARDEQALKPSKKELRLNAEGWCWLWKHI